MAEVNKWSVTYTKHLKQKRKIYHDGYLLLLSNNKVVLYDDSEKLLGGRFLKEDESVCSGDTLAIETFLVDIGNLENADCVKEEESNNSSANSARKCVPGRQKFPAIKSPTQKIIKEFKKQEWLKYEAPQSPKSSTSVTVSEWKALYTTHLTQKAKRYHDGFLQLVLCGSQGRQVKLYDASKNILESRFTKKEEVICSGEMLKFDGYLVDIGDLQENHALVGSSKIPVQNSHACGRMQMTERHWSSHRPSADKRISLLKNSKSLTSQHAADGTVAKGQLHIGAFSRSNLVQSLSGTRADRNESRKGVTSQIAYRDANEILSILKKPNSPKSLFVKEEVPMKQCFPQQVLVHRDFGEQYDEQVASKVSMRASSLKCDDLEPSVSQDDPISACEIKIKTDSSDDGNGLPSRSSFSDDTSFGRGNINNMKKPNPTEGGVIFTSSSTSDNTRPLTTGSAHAMPHPLIVFEGSADYISSRGLSESAGSHSHPKPALKGDDEKDSSTAMEIKLPMKIEDYPSFDRGF